MNKTVVRKMYEDFMFDGKPKTWDEYLEMEKQQIIDTYNQGLSNGGMDYKKFNNGIHYFFETYGSNGSDENFKQFSLYEHKETIATSDTPTSHQIEISEHRFTEKDIRVAYMQGYNRGVDGNPNHMESYIEHLKSTKQSQTEISDENAYTNGYLHGYNAAIAELPKEISDEEIEKASNEGWVVLDSNRTDNWIRGAKWYREQLQNKNI